MQWCQYIDTHKIKIAQFTYFETIWIYIEEKNKKQVSLLLLYIYIY